MLWTLWIAVGAFQGALGVMMGAFGGHALRDTLSVRHLDVYEVAVRYQMYHAFALIAVGLLATRIESWQLKAAGISFFAGSVLFSGSLYLLTLAGLKWLGAVTPVGGLGLIAGWLFLAAAAISL